MQTRVRACTTLGFTLLELVVVISILGIFAVLVIDRLHRYAEFAEKTSMEYTANIINSALLFEFATRVIRGKRGEIPQLAQVNPVKWLAQEPSNYLGEFRDPPLNEDQRGNWYYDAANSELVYLVRRTRPARAWPSCEGSREKLPISTCTAILDAISPPPWPPAPSASTQHRWRSECQWPQASSL